MNSCTNQSEVAQVEMARILAMLALEPLEVRVWRSLDVMQRRGVLFLSQCFGNAAQIKAAEAKTWGEFSHLERCVIKKSLADIAEISGRLVEEARDVQQPEN